VGLENLERHLGGTPCNFAERVKPTWPIGLSMHASRTILALSTVLLLSGCWYKDLAYHQRHVDGTLRRGPLRTDGYYYRMVPDGPASVIFFYPNGMTFRMPFSGYSSLDSLEAAMQAHHATKNGRNQYERYLADHGFYDVGGDTLTIDHYCTVLNGIPRACSTTAIIHGDTAFTVQQVETRPSRGVRSVAVPVEKRYRFRSCAWRPTGPGALERVPSFLRKGRRLARGSERP
jgi:hypothetical protein